MGYPQNVRALCWVLYAFSYLNTSAQTSHTLFLLKHLCFMLLSLKAREECLRYSFNRRFNYHFPKTFEIKWVAPVAVWARVNEMKFDTLFPKFYFLSQSYTSLAYISLLKWNRLRPIQTIGICVHKFSPFYLYIWLLGGGYVWLQKMWSCDFTEEAVKKLVWASGWLKAQ